MLARAVVVDRWLRPGLEVCLGRGRFREQRPDRVELFGPREVRGAGDRDLAIVQIGSGSYERERLERLRGRPQERDKTRIAGFGDDPPVAHRDGVHRVDRLDHAASGHLDLDRAGHSVGIMPACPSCRKWKPGCASSTRWSPGRPIERAGPGHIATVKTFDPPLVGPRRPAFRRCEPAWEEPAVPD